MLLACPGCGAPHALPDDRPGRRAPSIPCRRCGIAINPASECQTRVEGALALKTQVAPAEWTWHVAQHGERKGEFTLAQVERALASGALTPRAQVWRAGMPAWKPMAEVPEFKSILTPRLVQSGPQPEVEVRRQGPPPMPAVSDPGVWWKLDEHARVHRPLTTGAEALNPGAFSASRAPVMKAHEATVPVGVVLGGWKPTTLALCSGLCSAVAVTVALMGMDVLGLMPGGRAVAAPPRVHARAREPVSPPAPPPRQREEPEPTPAVLPAQEEAVSAGPSPDSPATQKAILAALRAGETTVTAQLRLPPRVRTALPAARLQSALSRQAGALKKCLSALPRGTEVDVAARFLPAGKVVSARAASAGVPAGARRCVADQVGRWRVPSFRGGAFDAGFTVRLSRR